MIVAGCPQTQCSMPKKIKIFMPCVLKLPESETIGNTELNAEIEFVFFMNIHVLL